MGTSKTKIEVVQPFIPIAELEANTVFAVAGTSAEAAA